MLLGPIVLRDFDGADEGARQRLDDGFDLAVLGPFVAALVAFVAARDDARRLLSGAAAAALFPLAVVLSFASFQYLLTGTIP